MSVGATTVEIYIQLECIYIYINNTKHTLCSWEASLKQSKREAMGLNVFPLWPKKL